MNHTNQSPVVRFFGITDVRSLEPCFVVKRLSYPYEVLNMSIALLPPN